MDERAEMAYDPMREVLPVDSALWEQLLSFCVDRFGAESDRPDALIHPLRLLREEGATLVLQAGGLKLRPGPGMQDEYDEWVRKAWLVPRAKDLGWLLRETAAAYRRRNKPQP